MTDVSNFSEEFTSMPAVDSPSVVPPNVEDVFQNYSFVAPSVLFAENNVISEDLFRPNPDKKPSTSNLVGCKLKVRRVFEKNIMTHCGNFGIFLSLRCYVKSILEN